MNNIKYTIWMLIVLVAGLAACQDEDDNLKDITFNDRSILEFNMDGQIGPAVIETIGEDSGRVLISVPNNVDITNMVPELALSYKATSSPESGEQVNFGNEDSTLVYSVTSASGKVRNWSVKLREVNIEIEGTWKIDEFMLYYLIAPTEPWGWSGTKNVTDYLSGASFEIDNLFTFDFEKGTREGNLRGTFTHSKGVDDQYGNFVKEDQTIPAPPANDWSELFRKLPIDNGVWEHNLTTNTVQFNQAGASVDFEVSFEDDGNTLVLTYVNNDWGVNAIWEGNPKNPLLELSHTERFWYKFSRVEE
ncbi:hypothetical protein [Reichenbachiella versicolor]|uniref:hypothetical protein n=1 Tax=Reichenbachiella versicolor TaxID=1821036 RepID=UPI0013A5A913|nr:hypothetical protein [Reichenbachiella versicolor]